MLLSLRQRLAAALIALSTIVDAIPVDNNVEGEPEIECGPTSITVNFNTRNPFQGHVFVKGLFDQDNCRNDEGGRQVAGIELAFDSCNVARTRSLNPKGIYVTTTVVISFHPQFVTKVDGAYRIQCFYMESDKTVSADVEVSDLTTHMQTALVPMPVCKYEILAGGPTGEPVQFASVGQQVYHKWTCESETQDTFCAVVHSCTVDDGNGDRLLILDEDGCALDKFILNNLEYPEDLMAGQEAHVYKYADRNQLFYQCQISITVKEPHEECSRPQCSEPTTYGAKKADAAVVAPPPPPPDSDSSTYRPSSAAPSSSATATRSRPRFAALRTTTPRANSTTDEESNDSGVHTGAANIFTSASAEAALTEDAEEGERRPPLRLLRKKRGLRDGRDGVKSFTLDEEVRAIEAVQMERQKRNSDDADHTVDVRAELTAIDYSDAELVLADLLRAKRAAKRSATAAKLISIISSPGGEVCVSVYAVSAIAAILLISSVGAFTLAYLLLRPGMRKEAEHEWKTPRLF